MSHTLKKTLISALVRILGWATTVGSPLHKAVLWAVRPLRALARIVFRFIVVPLYSAAYVGKRMLRKVILPVKNRFMFVVANRYLAHGLLVFLTIVTSAASVHAREVRAENLGEQSLLYKLVRGDDELVLQEEVLAPAGARAVSYFDPDAVSADGSQDDINLIVDPDIAVSGGGTGVIQPNFSGTDVTPTGQRTKPEVYTVQEGDTLSTIAQAFGVTINTILWENNKTPRDFIRPGDTLTILPVSGVSYTVKKGDTLGAIAQKHKIEGDAIVTANQLASAADLRIGEKLILPGAVPFSVPTPAVRRPIATVREIFTPDKGGAVPPSKTPGATRMVWPTDMRVITQYFSWRHSGLDIDGHYQNGIYAAEAGVVTHAGWGRTHGGYGYYVDIDHGGGILTRYGHASKIFVSVGDQVTKGQTIAMVGTTGRSTGTHLHFEVRVNGRVTNPLDWTR